MSWADAHDEDFQPKVYDDLTGHELNRNEVMKARLNEIEGLASMGVWDAAPREQCIARTGREPVRGRWADINKGDDNNKVYRLRYGAMEMRKMHGVNAREGLFAAMPPLEALELLISFYREQWAQSARKGRAQAHVHRHFQAYLHADVINPEMYVELPAEMNLPNHCGHLKKALYGTRNAAKCWENDYSTTISTQRYDRGKASQCLFKHAASGSMVLIHGDDFVVSGPETHLKELKKAICEKYKAKVRASNFGP